MNYRSAETGVDMTLRKAFTEYENQDYSAALELFQEVLKKRPEDNATNLYAGVAQIETEQYNAANHKFKTIMNHGANLFYEQAEWYSGFCYLKMDSTQKAIMVYRTIASGNSSYKNQASKILDKLEQEQN
jgi:predicted Zn-dependent protease